MKSRFTRRQSAALLFATVSCVRLLAADNLVADPQWKLGVSGDGLAKMTTSNDTMTIRIEHPTSPFYLIQLNQPVGGAVAEGERVRLAFKARSTTHNPVRAVLERSGPPYESVAETRVTLGDAWADYSCAGEALQPYAPGGLSARFQCGYQTGSIEIASIRVEDLGPDPAGVAAKAAIEPAAVDARIEKVRTGELRVFVRGENGRAIKGAGVKVEMTRSAFLFGCNFFGLNPDDSSQTQADYRSGFTNLFNYATLPFYWGTFEREQGKPGYERLDGMVKWCNEHSIETKGHPLVWHEVYPRWASRLPEGAIPQLRQRVTDIVRHYNGQIRIWDILNEANNAPDFENGEGRWIKRDGAAAVIAIALGWGREAAGTNKAAFIYNDYNVGAENEQLIATLKKNNTLPDFIGLQSHMHDHVWPMRRAWQVCERFAAFGRPLHFTELTVISATNQPKSYDAKPGEWPTTPEGEALQAAYVEQFYKLLYSHPSVQAITWWDFSDRHAWRNAPSGLVREDMSPKPAYEKLRALIRDKWWTRAEGKTDATGTFTARGHQGTYHITVTAAAGRTSEMDVELPVGATSRSITMRLQ